jgi:hypothetical protein
MENNITDIVKIEYGGIESAKLVSNIEIVNDGITSSYRIKEDGKLYLYTEQLILDDHDRHLSKFQRIYRTAIRDKNIEILTSE